MTIDVSKPLAPKPVSQERFGDSLRFAPNFSVYVLPPDAVCLYSEDRKFFLRGALYCALAERIGAGEDAHAIRQALSAEFPVDSIDEAFKRLLDRRFIVPAGASDDVAAAYWASLGLQPEVATKNLQKVSVQIEAIGIGGARELE
ncbi:MAG: hypothetical protein Q8M72_00830 [Methylocystis sp.]|nr:hypothetical protein [Methylocystis sp.]